MEAYDEGGRLAGPTRADRAALRALQLGAIAVVLAACTYKVFDLDRYFVPKELALHLTALLAALLALGGFRRTLFTRVDLLLLGYLALSALSAALAGNGWLAVRALAVSASGVAVFWAARTVRERASPGRSSPRSRSPSWPAPSRRSCRRTACARTSSR